MTKTVYIAGPMRGHDYYNMDAFNKAATALRAVGWNVINPVEVDLKYGIDIAAMPETTNWRIFPPALSFRVTALTCCEGVIRSDAIYLLKGWQGSTGARAEAAIAKWLELEFMYE